MFLIQVWLTKRTAKYKDRFVVAENPLPVTVVLAAYDFGPNTTQIFPYRSFISFADKRMAWSATVGSRSFADNKDFVWELARPRTYRPRKRIP